MHFSVFNFILWRFVIFVTMNQDKKGRILPPSYVFISWFLDGTNAHGPFPLQLPQHSKALHLEALEYRGQDLLLAKTEVYTEQLEDALRPLLAKEQLPSIDL